MTYHISEDNNIFDGVSLQHWMIINWKRERKRIKSQDKMKIIFRNIIPVTQLYIKQI